MADVAQEASTPVETQAPAFNVEAVAKAAVEEVTTVAKEIVAAVETVEERLRVEISDAEKVVVLRQENQFLQLTTQARELQKQIENIQKNFPEYLKGLAVKYSVDLKEYAFNSIEGVFNKKQ